MTVSKQPTATTNNPAPAMPAQATQHTTNILRETIGWASALIAAGLAGFLVYCLFVMTEHSICEFGFYSWCGFDRAQRRQALTYYLPPLLLIQLICVIVTYYCNHGLILARCATAVAAGYFAACVLIIVYTHDLLFFMIAP